MQYMEMIALTLSSNGFFKDEATGLFTKDRYDIEVLPDKTCSIRYLQYFRKNEKEETKVRVRVFNGVIRNGVILEVIINSVCYER